MVSSTMSELLTAGLFFVWTDQVPSNANHRMNKQERLVQARKRFTGCETAMSEQREPNNRQSLQQRVEGESKTNRNPTLTLWSNHGCNKSALLTFPNSLPGYTRPRPRQYLQPLNSCNSHSRLIPLGYRLVVRLLSVLPLWSFQGWVALLVHWS